MTSDYAIRIENLSKCYHVYSKPTDRLKQVLLKNDKPRYQEFWALRDINLEIKKGEAVGIIGENGSGKSTLLQLICKTLTPTNGNIHTHGKIAALLELGAGFNPEFTGRENVYLNGTILGFSRKEMDARISAIESFADIGNFIDQPVKTYSSGMFVRLAFAVQICVEPEILVIDEALAVGDVFFQQKCYQRLAQLLSRGTTIILVSHTMTQIEQFCQRGLVLSHGKNIFWGKANEAVRNYYLLQQNNYITNTFEETSQTSKSNTYKTPYDIAEFFNLENKTQVSNGWARCIRATLCNQELQYNTAFQQGDTAIFYYEFELLHPIEIPSVGIAIKNREGTLVHGKSTLEYGSDVPTMLSPKDILCIKQEIKLDLAIGEYTFEIALAALSKLDYGNRSHMNFTQLSHKISWLCSIPDIGTLTITPRQSGTPVQLLHHGIADLPGNCLVTTHRQTTLTTGSKLSNIHGNDILV